MQSRLARLLQRRIAAALGMPVRVERWRGSLKHRTVELHGVTAGVEPGAGGSFAISIDRVSATLRVRTLARPRLVIESLRLERPRLRLASGPDDGPPGSVAAPEVPPTPPGMRSRRRRWFALRDATVVAGELHLVPRSPVAFAGSAIGITARLEPAAEGQRLEAGAASVAIRGMAFPGIQVVGRVSAGETIDLMDAPLEANWTFGSLARGTAATSALRTDDLHVEGEAHARVEDLAALESLAGVLAPVLRLANDGVIDVTFRAAFGAAGPRLETLSARLELRG